MAGEDQGGIWPLPKFHFAVRLSEDLDEVAFQEVDGLETESQIIEYRHGDSKALYPIKMPGLAKLGVASLRKGVFVNDRRFRDWCDEIETSTVRRRTVVVRLLDESGTPKMTWTLNNAWPTKIDATGLGSEGDEVTVDSVEIAYETLTMTTPAP